jgi:hypothetical protein
LAGGVAALAGLALVLRVLGPTPAPRFTSLAVMYFENLTDRADSDNLGRMLTGLLTTELSGTEGLDGMSSQRLHDIAKQRGAPMKARSSAPWPRRWRGGRAWAPWSWAGSLAGVSACS